MGMYCFGIDVGGTSVKCGLFLTNGTLVEQWEIPTRLENNGSSILPDVADAIKTKLDERGITKDNVDGVGIGIPGPVNENGEVPMAVNLHWGFKAVASELSALTGLPAKAANDAGVGGGIIIDSKIIAGYHGAGGEIGHACVNHNEVRPCNCGNHGCLEQYASATGIVRVANDILEESKEDSKMRHVEKLSAKNVLDFYKEGDALAVKTMEKVGDILGSTLAVFACVTDPEAIVIGGGVSKAGKPLTDCIQKYYQKYAFPSCKSTPIILASLGNDAGIYGAARMVIKD